MRCGDLKRGAVIQAVRETGQTAGYLKSRILISGMPQSLNSNWPTLDLSQRRTMSKNKDPVSGDHRMPQYSAHFIGSEGQITQRIALACTDDIDAHQQAIVLATSHTMELWQRDRLLATYVPCV